MCDIRRGEATAVSGRFLKDGNRGSGWKMTVITGRLSSIEIQTVAAPFNSATEEQSSTHFDLQGFVAWLSVVEKSLGCMAQGSIKEGCDSNAALKVIQKWM